MTVYMLLELEYRRSKLVSNFKIAVAISRKVDESKLGYWEAFLDETRGKKNDNVRCAVLSYSGHEIIR